MTPWGRDGGVVPVDRWKAMCLREETAQGKAALGAVSPLHGGAEESDPVRGSQ